MPLHDFICLTCKSIFEAFQTLDKLQEYEKCPNCPGVGKKNFSRASVSLSLFREGFYELEDPGKDPYISSLKQLKEECKRRNLVSRYVQESGVLAK